MRPLNLTSSTNSPGSAGAGISGGYQGDSLTLQVLIILFPSLSIYNALELLILIFFTFNKYKGLYFWSLLVASVGIVPYSIGFLIKFLNIGSGNAQWTGVVLLTIGWYTMVTGQSVVLWSRLHLLLGGRRGSKVLTWTKWMIIVNAIALHIPTTVLTFGSNGRIDTAAFVRGYNIMEKIQMSGFFVQELILSGIYISETTRIIRWSIREHTRKLMWQLLCINVLIVIMDIALLGLEAASLYLLETLTKGVFYSIKLKLEFAILGKLVQFVGRSSNSVANEERNRKASLTLADYDADNKSRSSSTAGRVSVFPQGVPVDMVAIGRARTNGTQKTASAYGSGVVPERSPTSPGDRRSRTGSISIRPGVTADDIDIAMFQHLESIPLPSPPADEERPRLESSVTNGVAEGTLTGGHRA